MAPICRPCQTRRPLIFFVLLEMMFRRRLPERVENWIHMTGFVLLIALMIFVTWQDVYNLFWTR